MNVGDIIFQFIMLLFILGITFAIFLVVRSLVKDQSRSKNMEQKLDKIIEMLEKEKQE
ncbi:DUF4083 family protein [Siminovitchia fortis]|uniref:DUF4083 domain-containing protein n=1 Tax=Siminovitchia fortis TaxID=254758 RepID=A0A443IK70_9BACI|nr:DUF4083 family protein [Siminovitchia fortis]RWR05047.1 DUF4083 domain-containing protein [Siminovitchia fortis]WHY83604.1 DUF4083 family protein [Siminovitchia fortis]